MTTYHQVAATEEIPIGSAKEVVLEGKIVAIFNVEGTYYAIDGMCAHAGGPLATGNLEGKIITCPWHGWQYDVSTGRHCLTPNICQTLYKIEIDNEKILIVID